MLCVCVHVCVACCECMCVYACVGTCECNVCMCPWITVSPCQAFVYVCVLNVTMYICMCDACWPACICIQLLRPKISPVEVRMVSAIAKLYSYQLTNKAQTKSSRTHKYMSLYTHKVSKAQWPDKQCTQKSVAF